MPLTAMKRKFGQPEVADACPLGRHAEDLRPLSVSSTTYADATVRGEDDHRAGTREDLGRE